MELRWQKKLKISLYSFVAKKKFLVNFQLFYHMLVPSMMICKNHLTLQSNIFLFFI